MNVTLSSVPARLSNEFMIRVTISFESIDSFAILSLLSNADSKLFSNSDSFDNNRQGLLVASRLTVFSFITQEFDKFQKSSQVHRIHWEPMCHIKIRFYKL